MKKIDKNAEELCGIDENKIDELNKLLSYTVTPLREDEVFRMLDDLRQYVPKPDPVRRLIEMLIMSIRFVKKQFWGYKLQYSLAILIVIAFITSSMEFFLKEKDQQTCFNRNAVPIVGKGQSHQFSWKSINMDLIKIQTPIETTKSKISSFVGGQNIDHGQEAIKSEKSGVQKDDTKKMVAGEHPNGSKRRVVPGSNYPDNSLLGSPARTHVEHI